MAQLPICEAVEPRRLLTELNFSSNSDTVVMWRDSAGYNRFGPSAGNTYYFPNSQTPPTTTSTSGSLYRFSAGTPFMIKLNGGNDKFSVNSNVVTAGNITFYSGSGSDTMGGGNGDDTFYCGGDNQASDYCSGGNGHDYYYLEQHGTPPQSYIDFSTFNDGSTDGVQDTTYTTSVLP